MKVAKPVKIGAVLLAILGSALMASAERPSDVAPREATFSPDVWRNEKRIIDMHMHIEGKPERFDRAIQIMDSAGIGVGIELGSGTVTRTGDQISEFERSKQLSDSAYPGRFLHYMLLDYKDWDQRDWSERAVQQIEEGHRLGAAGLKEYKRLGLFLRDDKGQLIRIDDPKLDPVWAKCGELGMPISIHVADPKAFWEPFVPSNERWAELKDHPDWWFGDSAKYPPRMDLLEALLRVISRHPQTTFVAVHVASNAEEIDWVDQALTKHPNMMADLAARIPEIGRHLPEKVRELFVKHQDRILFATDFMVYDRLILGSAGDAERPSNTDAYVFYQKHWRFLETLDRDWAHMTPIQGAWRISSIGLPPEVLRKIYFDNARKLLARSWPLPVMTAHRIGRDFAPDGKLTESEWGMATPVRLEYSSSDAHARPELSTVARALWSEQYLYLGFESPYAELSARPLQGNDERLGLWEYDVVEAFIAPDLETVNSYSEYEWAPNGEQLDVRIDPSQKDFSWTSAMESAVNVDDDGRCWRVEARIPLASISEQRPTPGARWRLNLFRHDLASQAYLAWNPTLTQTFHTPEKFGWLEFAASDNGNED